MSRSVAPPLELDDRQRAYLLFLGCFVARAANNDQSALAKEWMMLPSLSVRLGVPQHELERSLLDALVLVHVFVGVPKTIEAFAACQGARRHDYVRPVAKPAADYLWNQARDPDWAHPLVASPPPPPCDACNDDSSSSIRRARASATLSALYTSAAPGLEVFLAGLHPELHRAIVSHGYGAIMCTRQLKLFEIEVVAVAVLSGTHTPRQLVSHLRGALIVGLPAEFVSKLIDECFEEVWQDDGIHAESKEVWRGLQRAARAKARGGLDREAEEKMAEEALYQDALAKSKRLAARGEQHELYSVGRGAGGGDEADDVEVESQLERPRPTARSVPQPAHAETEVSDEDVAANLRAMMRARAKTAATDLALRQAGASLPPADDRWPIPPHVLDPSGMGAMSMMGMGAGGAGGMPMGMGGGGLEGVLRARL